MKPLQRTDASAELATLFEETVALYHRLTADASSIHGLGSLSGPRRTVLMALTRTGPRTVAHMARDRAQSRQRFQPLVDRLIADGLVEARSNPMHKQSRLMTLTAKGEQAVARIVQRERTMRAQLRPQSSRRSLRSAAAVLRDVRHTLESQLPGIIRSTGRLKRS
jgi:DNA-binding MarR family transcriptional regulator